MCQLVSIIGSILSNIVADFIFAFLILLSLQRFRYWYRLKRNFHNKSFDAYWKNSADDIVYTVKCKVNANRITFYGKRNEDANEFEGEFIINPINLKTGEGYHTHKYSDGFAFYKIIIYDENTFFVEAPYIDANKNEKGRSVGQIVYQAYIWKIKKENQK